MDKRSLTRGSRRRRNAGSHNKAAGTAMDSKIDWVRMLRTMGVAALLVIALLGAVLGSIGRTSPVWNWACVRAATPPPDAAHPAPG